MNMPKGNQTVSQLIKRLQIMVEEMPETSDLPVQVRGFGQGLADDHDINGVIIDTKRNSVTLSANYYGA
jgi:hypothetical protein